MAQFPIIWPATFPAEQGSWVSDRYLAVSNSIKIKFVAEFATGSSSVKYDILSSQGSSLQGLTLADVGSNNIEIANTVVGSEYKVLFSFTGDPDLGGSYTPKVKDFSVETVGGRMQTSNLGSDVKLSSTSFNRCKYTPAGSFVHLLAGSFSTNGGQDWFPANPNKEIIIPDSSAGSEILFRADDRTGSVTAERIRWVIKQDDF